MEFIPAINFSGFWTRDGCSSKRTRRAQADYTARGMGPFTYEMKGKVMTMAYHEVPPDVLENAPELTAWARRAIQLAAAKPKKRLKRK